MKIRTDFVTNSSSSSFVLELNFTLKNGSVLSYVGEAGCGESDAPFNELLVTVSPKQLGTAKSIKELTDLLKKGVKHIYDENEDCFFDKNDEKVKKHLEDYDFLESEYEDAQDFVADLEKLKSVDEISEISITGNEYNYQNYLRTYTYNLTTKEYTQDISGEPFEKDGGSGGDLDF